MNFPLDPILSLKVSGAIATGLGSVLLAWRVKQILKWVVYCLVTHEQSIDQLTKLTNNQAQTKPIVGGVTIHLLDIESKLGLVLLIAGFLLLGVGMLCNASTYLLGNVQ